jgi:mannose-6-phosphate isomerase-like protein (cupin superfamily)
MSKYGKYIVTDLKTPDFRPEFVDNYKKFATRILWMDSNNVPGAFQMNCSWYLHPNTHGAEAHQHDVDEIIGFFSNDSKNPYDLGGEIELWLEDEKFLITKSAMVYLPAGMKHCPLIIRRVDRPIFHFSTVTGGSYIQQKMEGNVFKPQTQLKNYIVTELKEPEARKKLAPVYNKYAKRVLWLDKDVVPGAYNMNVSWYLKASQTIDDKPHTHTSDEIIGFFSNDANNPHDLGGEVEIWLEGEKQIITKSAMIFVPAGLTHCPLKLNRVTRPIFHFTVVIAGSYIKNEK